MNRARPTALRGLTRLLLVGLGTLPLSLPFASSSCSTPFDPPSVVNTLRVISVEIDKPYAQPGDTVSFDMTLADGRSAEDLSDLTNIVWIGGCVNPPGGTYYGCYESLGPLFADLAEGGVPPEGLIGGGPGVTTFSLDVPEDILEEAPEPNYGPKIGTAFVFFIACGGELGLVDQSGDTSASFFPLACFDEDGRQLGPEAFIPGYTQIFVFEDERQNANPIVDGLLVDDELLEEDAVLTVGTCPIALADRQRSGCSAPDEFEECTSLTIDVQVPEEAAELDPDATDAEGNQLTEVLWVSYFASGGQFEFDIKLVADASKGLVEERTTRWVPPEDPGIYSIWAVVRDNRGGSTTLTHVVQVDE